VQNKQEVIMFVSLPKKILKLLFFDSKGEFYPLSCFMIFFCSAVLVYFISTNEKKDKRREEINKFSYGQTYKLQNEWPVAAPEVQSLAIPIKDDWFIQNGLSVLPLDNGWIVRDPAFNTITFVPKQALKYVDKENE
jgi:hypothetical protein